MYFKGAVGESRSSRDKEQGYLLGSGEAGNCESHGIRKDPRMALASVSRSCVQHKLGTLRTLVLEPRISLMLSRLPAELFLECPKFFFLCLQLLLALGLFLCQLQPIPGVLRRKWGRKS